MTSLGNPKIITLLWFGDRSMYLLRFFSYDVRTGPRFLHSLHPQQTCEQLPPHSGERLHSGDGEALWNDRHGRTAAEAGTAVLECTTATSRRSFVGITNGSHRPEAALRNDGGVAMCLRTDVLDWLVALAFQSR